MELKERKTIELIRKNVIVEYSADVTFRTRAETYGEDADGNRGQVRNYSEVIELDNFQRNGQRLKLNRLPSARILDLFFDLEPESEGR